MACSIKFQVLTLLQGMDEWTCDMFELAEATENRWWCGFDEKESKCHSLQHQAPLNARLCPSDEEQHGSYPAAR